MVTTILLILALVCFFLAMVDFPPAQHWRLIAAGMFLQVLVVLMGVAGR